MRKLSCISKKYGKNNITRILLVMLIFSIIFIFFGCSGSASKVTIEELEDSVIRNAIDKNAMLSIEEINGGYEFHYTDNDDWWGETKVFGSADKNKYIKNVSIEKNEIDVIYFMNLTGEDVALRAKIGFDDLNLSQVNSILMYGYVAEVIGLGEGADFKSNDSLATSLNMVHKAVSSPQKSNGWTYSFVCDVNEETVTFNAFYGS